MRRTSAQLFNLALVMVMAALPPGGTFVDDDGDPHEGSIEAIAEIEVTKGCNPPTNSRFCPRETVTRGEMAAFLSRALALSPGEDMFVDDDGHLFESEINKLVSARITLGCDPPVNSRFCPDAPMTRGQMAAMLTRAFGYPSGDHDAFVDDDGHLFEEPIDGLAAVGITKGCNPPTNDRYCPDDAITRGQMASLLTRALGLEPILPPPRAHPVVTMASRGDWGARPPETNRMEPHSVERLTIHHAGAQTGTTGPAQFRGWQNWHMDGRNWPDIAYHVLIGIDGTVYEGRDPAFRGDTGTSYDTTGHFLVVVEGNFDLEQPTEPQFDSLVRTLAWASQEYGVSTATISGHRDHAATSCPGASLGALIDSGEIRSEVEALVQSGGIELIWP